MRLIHPVLSMLALAIPVIAQTSYVDNTASAGLSLSHTPHANHPYWAMLPGVATGDFNNDGWPDLYAISGGTSPDKLFINQGNGQFIDQATQWGLTDSIFAAGACVGDFNRDGWQDIYVVSGGDAINGAIPNACRLYQNNGNGTFTDVAQTAGVAFGAGCGCSKSAVWSDYDHDGWLDLLVTANDLSVNPNRLYHNNQDGTFSDVTVSSGLDLGPVYGLGASFTDFDGDRWPDLLLLGDHGTSRYYINERDGTFSQVVGQIQDLNQVDAMGIATGDFDEDGDIDFHLSDVYYAVTNLQGSRLLINDGDHNFSEHGVSAGVNTAGWAWGNAATDIDNDGLLDIISTNGWNQNQWTNFPTQVFYNLGGMMFAEISSWCGLIHFGQGRGLIKWDPDRDGDEDLVISSSEEDLLSFRNDLANGNAWLRVEFDTSHNPALAPDGFGTTVWAKANGRSLVRQLDSSVSYLSQHELAVHFGFGPGVTQVDELKIEWADGFDTILTNVGVNQHLTVQGSGPLSSTPLIRGQVATLKLTGAQVGEQVAFLFSLSGLGTSPPVPQLGGQRLGILPPVRLIGTAIADGTGLASHSAMIPIAAPPISVALQAVIQRGPNAELSVISNSISENIQ